MSHKILKTSIIFIFTICVPSTHNTFYFNCPCMNSNGHPSFIHICIYIYTFNIYINTYHTYVAVSFQVYDYLFISIQCNTHIHRYRRSLITPCFILTPSWFSSRIIHGWIQPFRFSLLRYVPPLRSLFCLSFALFRRISIIYCIN